MDDRRCRAGLLRERGQVLVGEVRGELVVPGLVAKGEAKRMRRCDEPIPHLLPERLHGLAILGLACEHVRVDLPGERSARVDERAPEAPTLPKAVVARRVPEAEDDA